MSPLLLLFLLPTLSYGAKLPALISPQTNGGRIVNGEDSSPGQFPYQASLQFVGLHICGVSVISNEWLLTAAHCVTLPTIGYGVFLGEIDLREDTSGVRPVVLDIISHPEYTEDIEAGYNADLALVHTEPFSFNDNIQPIALADEDDSFVGENCFLSGWGRQTAKIGEPNANPDILQWMSVRVISLEQCIDMMDEFFEENQELGIPSVHDYHVCFLDDEGVQSACQGDSGGPAACPKGDGYVLVGAASWVARTNTVCFTDYPSVYASSIYYRQWIRDVAGI